MGEPIWTNNLRISLSWRRDCYGHEGRALFVGALCAGNTMSHNGEWRAWVMTDEVGAEVGWYPTEQEAKDALVDKVLALLLEGDGG